MTGPSRATEPHPHVGVHREDRAAPSRPALPAQVRRHAELALRLASALSSVEDAQHQRAGIGWRSESLVSDPTGDTAADPRRLALRAAVVHAELMLESTAQALEHALRQLDRATDRWSGEDY